MAISNIALTSAMRANLYSLQKTTDLMELTQNRLSTGKKVNSALDDPIAYFAAEAHTQRATDLSALKDEMSEGIQTITAANNGIEAITDLVASAKSIAQAALASSSSTERSDYASQFNDLMDKIDDLAGDAGYKGANLLDDDDLTINFNEDASSTLTVSGFDASSTGLAIADAVGSWATDANITAAIADLDDARTTLRTESKNLSIDLSTVTIRQDFTDKMVNTLGDGAANLTLADMNEEGANMLMLQTRQSLGTTSLALASQAAQSVLRLF
jgi:flagellin-like hook-associated protein FlgL